MIVKTREEAWKAADEMFLTDYQKDEVKSESAGYTVYRSRINNDSINDLDSRLEIIIDNKTINIWIVEENVEETAAEIAEVVVTNGWNYARPAQEKEKDVIFKIAQSALKKTKKAKTIETKQKIYKEAEEKLRGKLAYLNAEETLFALKIAIGVEESFDEETEKEAEKIASFITLRSESGNLKLKTKKREKNIIFQIALKALQAIQTNDDSKILQYICDSAEIKLNRKLEKCNGYETLYLPLKEIITKWKTKSCKAF